MRQPNSETHFKKLRAVMLLNALHASVSAADEMSVMRTIAFDGVYGDKPAENVEPLNLSCEYLLHGIDEPRKAMLHALMSVIVHTSNVTARVLNAIQLTPEGIMAVGEDDVSVDISLECKAAMAELLKLAQGAAGIELNAVKEQIIKFER